MRRQVAALVLLVVGAPALVSACSASDDGSPDAAPAPASSPSTEAGSSSPSADSTPDNGPDNRPTDADVEQFVDQCKLAMHKQITFGDEPPSSRRQLERRCEAAPDLAPRDLARLVMTTCVVSLTGAGPGAGVSEADARQQCRRSVRRGNGPGSVLLGAFVPSLSG